MSCRMTLGGAVGSGRSVEVQLQGETFRVDFFIIHTGDEIQAAIRKMCAEAGIVLDFDEHLSVFKEISAVAEKRPTHIEKRHEIGWPYMQQQDEAAGELVASAK